MFECPECGTLNEGESILSFPKNLALINMKSQTKASSLKTKQPVIALHTVAIVH